MYMNVNFGDHSIATTVTSSAASVETWINRVKNIHRRRLYKLVVGLDIEWRPNTSRYFRNPVAVLQLCVGHHCLVFQLQYATMIPRALVDFLTNEDYTFVGVGIDEDVQKLNQDYGLYVGYTVDLRTLVSTRWNEPGFRNAGLVSLAYNVLDLVYVKQRNITLSDWSQPNLSIAQVQYSAIDAFLSFEIGKQLDAAHF
ncbi:Werner Syndrome-like exonuclease [Chenopodium quinoa]|uniref:3'-5' exonuclease domain-containing protein n=1 Tax=Chenopodium quinoa TaxID=63459 RepID=A0A803LZY6_CHEQI|nr:Werner Syndrome-like exonuclease [Chenopodium quinoa]